MSVERIVEAPRVFDEIGFVFVEQSIFQSAILQQTL
jgi:hypothetical protein